MRKVDKFIIVWSVVSWLFWIWYSFISKSIFPGAVYYTLWVGVVGTWLYLYRRAISKRLQAWRFSPFLKFILLGYGAVLLEEIFAAFANNVSEGFSFPLLIVRIGQFWAFNLLAFTGFIFAWYFLIKTFRYSRREIFYLAGIWGIYSEGIYRQAATNPIAVLFLIAPTILTYGIIITPAMRSFESGKRSISRPIKYLLTYFLIYILSLLPLLILLSLRNHYPYLFPPTKFIQ